MSARRDPAPGIPAETWSIRETVLDLAVLEQAGSVFALANGHLGLRGNLDEGEPAGLPGTYLNGLYEQRPLPHAEAAYGDPRRDRPRSTSPTARSSGCWSTMSPSTYASASCAATNGSLDLRAGVLRRTAHWRSPAGKEVRISSARLVSFAQRAVAAILYEVEPLGAAARLVVQSELVANEPMPVAGPDPRRGSPLSEVLRCEHVAGHDVHVMLSHITRRSGLRMAAAMDDVVAAIRSMRHSPKPRTPAGRRCSPASAATWTISGNAPTSNSTVTPSCSRRSGSRCFTPCRPARAASGARSPPRG